MAYTIQRVGKSLVKFFKPVRMAPPHFPHENRPESSGRIVPESSGDDSRRGFRLLKFKKPETDKFAESKARTAAGDASLAEETPNPLLPEKAPAQWLDLVVGLLSACRRVSQKMRKHIGLETYRKTLVSRGKSKFQTLGSIVNTTATIVEEEPPVEEEKKVA